MGTSVTVTFQPGLPSPMNSSIAVSPSTAVADGQTPINVTVTFLDGTGNPVPGKSAAIQGHGSATLSPAAALSDGNGQAQFTLTDTVAENLTISGFDANDLVSTPTVNISFTPIPSVNLLDIEASSLTNPDDGTTVDTLTVTDTNNGSPVEGKTITIMESTGAHANVSPASVVTDVNGQAVFTVVDSKAESVTFTPVES